MIALLVLPALALVTQTTAAPLPQASNAGSTATAAAEQVARAAQQLRGDATIAAALTAVKVGTDTAEQALAAHGFQTALDLRLLAGGPVCRSLLANAILILSSELVDVTTIFLHVTWRSQQLGFAN